MILHASIMADHPERTAQFLAAMLDGHAAPLRGPGEGTWGAGGRNPVGNLIEVLRRGSEFHRGKDGLGETRSGAAVNANGFHLLLETPHEEDAAMALTEEHEISAARSGRGVFDLIETWIDGCQLIEWVTPTMAKAYRSLFEPERIDATARRFTRSAGRG